MGGNALKEYQLFSYYSQKLLLEHKNANWRHAVVLENVN